VAATGRGLSLVVTWVSVQVVMAGSPLIRDARRHRVRLV
jgi:hypothetical protein